MKDTFLQTFASLTRLGAGISWLDNARGPHLDACHRQNLPTQKDTLWKYIQLNTLTQTTFHPARAPHLDETKKAAILAACLPDTLPIVFVNGILQPELSHLSQLPNGINLFDFQKRLDIPLIREHLNKSLSTVTQSLFGNLNHAYFDSGFLLHVEEDTKISRPIQILFVQDPKPGVPHITMPHQIIQLDKNAQAQLHLHYLSLDQTQTYFHNPVLHLHLDREAHLNLSKNLQESSNAIHIAETQINLSDHAEIAYHSYAWQAALAHDCVAMYLNAPLAKATIFGSYYLKDSMQYHLHTLLSHDASNTSSQTTLHGLAQDKSKASFNGRIVGSENLKNIEAHLQNKNILLSKQAQMHTEPFLEIDTDDVVCTHGATVGALDEEALFHLRTAGIGELQAKSMLIEGFLQTIFSHMPHIALKQQLETTLKNRLGAEHA
jgi:Fe-S cluster assembly protein SufD